MACVLPLGHEGKHRLQVVPTCADPDCQRTPLARRLCAMHYARARRRGILPARVRVALVPPSTWQEAIDDWVTVMRARRMSPQTIGLRSYHLRRIGMDVEPGPWTITAGQLRAWGAAKRWSPETHRSVISSIRTFYAWAVAAGRTDVDPSVELSHWPSGPRNPKPVSEADYAAALAAADPRIRLMIRLSGALGLRRGEVSMVHRNDLVRDGDGFWLTVHGKGDKVRVVPIAASLAQDLAAFIREQGKSGYAFPSAGGGHLSAHWVGTLVSRNLPHEFTMHKLRHRALTQAYRASKDIVLTARLAGHASVVTTQSYYVQADYERMRMVAEQLDC